MRREALLVIAVLIRLDRAHRLFLGLSNCRALLSPRFHVVLTVIGYHRPKRNKTFGRRSGLGPMPQVQWCSLPADVSTCVARTAGSALTHDGARRCGLTRFWAIGKLLLCPMSALLVGRI